MRIEDAYLGTIKIVEMFLGHGLVQDLEPPVISTLYIDVDARDEQIFDGEFNYSIDSWTQDGGWSISNGIGIYSGSFSASRLSQDVYLEQGETYKWQLLCESNMGELPNQIIIGTDIVISEHFDVKQYLGQFVWQDLSGDYSFNIVGADSEVLGIDNISLFKI